MKIILFLSIFTISITKAESIGNRRILLVPDQPPVSPAPPPITGHHGLRQAEPIPPPALGGAPAMEPTSPPIAGLYGQDCTPASGDFPDKCATVGALLTSTNGKIECIHNHDCCICGQMICGPDCTGLTCNGDSSCFGVKYIDIEGEPVMGARIDCNGDVSCMQTNIRGTNINLMGCTGDFSCAYGRFHLECIPSGCPLACVGDDSCKGHPTNPDARAYFDVVNSFGLLCSHDSCRDATFNLIDNVGGAIVCGAEASCTQSTINAVNVEGVWCGGEFGCYESSFLLTNPQNGFDLSCNAFASCKGLSIEILITDPEIEHLRGIICNSAHACQGIKVTITKVVGPNPTSGSKDLYIEELSCGALHSCKDAIFDLGPNVHVEKCGCAGGLTQACQNILGVNQCNNGIQNLVCDAVTVCKNVVETLTNPLQDFELICNDPSACVGLDLTIILDGTKPITSFKGIKCGSKWSCKNMKITIINWDTTNTFDAGDVFCNSDESCVGMQIDLYYTQIQDTHCGTGNSCTACSVSAGTQFVRRCRQCSNMKTPCSPVGFTQRV